MKIDAQRRTRRYGAAEPALLAHHFTRAGVGGAAAKWWGKAGKQSIERSALFEAAEQITRALAQIAFAQGVRTSSAICRCRTKGWRRPGGPGRPCLARLVLSRQPRHQRAAGAIQSRQRRLAARPCSQLCQACPRVQSITRSGQSAGGAATGKSDHAPPREALTGQCQLETRSRLVRPTDCGPNGIGDLATSGTQGGPGYRDRMGTTWNMTGNSDVNRAFAATGDMIEKTELIIARNTPPKAVVRPIMKSWAGAAMDGGYAAVDYMVIIFLCQKTPGEQTPANAKTSTGGFHATARISKIFSCDDACYAVCARRES
jgi:hypothetical protein